VDGGASAAAADDAVATRTLSTEPASVPVLEREPGASERGEAGARAMPLVSWRRAAVLGLIAWLALSALAAIAGPDRAAEPAWLRWVRSAASHPVRTSLAAGLLARGILAGRSRAFAPGRDIRATGGWESHPKSL
jgi:hypothetical protein